MNILCIGDVVGSGAVAYLQKKLWQFRREERIDLVDRRKRPIPKGVQHIVRLGLVSENVSVSEVFGPVNKIPLDNVVEKSVLVFVSLIEIVNSKRIGCAFFKEFSVR